MKFSPFDDSENPEMLPKQQAPFLVLTIAVLVTGTIFIWSIHHSFSISREQSLIREETAKVVELKISGENFNRSSKTAIRMATNGDPNAESIYSEVAPQLFKVVGDAESLAARPPEKDLFDRVSAAQKRSAQTESEIFALLHEGKTEEARKLATGNDYEKNFW